MQKMFIVIGVILLAHAVLAADPSTLPLVQQSDITHIGAFRLPLSGGSNGSSYNGYGMAVYDDPVNGKTIIASCHNESTYILKVKIPADSGSPRLKDLQDNTQLDEAQLLQDCIDIQDGMSHETAWGTVCEGVGCFNTGMLSYNNRLIVSGRSMYGANQTKTHAYTGLTLSTIGDFYGGFSPTGYHVNDQPLSIEGPMALIPTEWQSTLAFSGTTPKAIGGNGGLSQGAGSSTGPSIHLFDPDAIGSGSTFAVKTVLYYPGDPLGVYHPLGVYDSTDPYWHGTAWISGLFWPSGTRSVMVFGHMGDAETYCYGTDGACGEVCSNKSWTGPHMPPYHYKIWAYDANDLVTVLGGGNPWVPQPYALWTVTMPTTIATGCDDTGMTTFDQSTGRLYVSTISNPFGTTRIDVFQVGAPSGETTTRRASGGGTIAGSIH